MAKDLFAIINGVSINYARAYDNGALKLRPKFLHHLCVEAGGKCQYCGDAVYHSNASVDHVIPKSKGGTHDVGNLRLCCSACNTMKNGRDVEYFRIALALSKSPIAGILNPAQAQSLKDCGVDLGIDIHAKFHFEATA